MRTVLIALALALTLPAVARPTDTPDVFKGQTAYCYLKAKTLTWRIGNDVIEQTVHFDRERGALISPQVLNKRSGSRLVPVEPSASEATTFGLAPNRHVLLSRDWAYSWQSVGTPAHRGRLLTIHLQGVGANRGLELESAYEVYPGNRPYIAHWYTLINRTADEVTLTRVPADLYRWVPSGKNEPRSLAWLRTKSERSAVVSTYDSAKRSGYAIGLSSPNGSLPSASIITGEAAGAVVMPTDAVLKPEGGRYMSDPIIVMLYTGAQDLLPRLWTLYPSVTRTVQTPGLMGK